MKDRGVELTSITFVFVFDSDCCFLGNKATGSYAFPLVLYWNVLEFDGGLEEYASLDYGEINDFLIYLISISSQAVSSSNLLMYSCYLSST